MAVRILQGDCRDVLRTLADASVDSIVTDPPYELGFMGKAWDKSGIAYDADVWRAALRVLKPGGHLLAFGGSRTYHRLTCAIEDAGFEIRDQIMWLYGSGFPKSLDVSKAIDKAAGAKRTEVVGRYQPPGMDKPWNLCNASDERAVEVFASSRNNLDVLAPVTDAAKQWQGWGTALKPAHEPIVIARKPLDGTVAANVLQYGTGALNIDGCRVPTGDDLNGGAYAKEGGRTESQSLHAGSGMNKPGKTAGRDFVQPSGRWPANVVHDGSEEVLAAFPAAPGQQGPLTGSEPSGPLGHANTYGRMDQRRASTPRGDTGSAARFFYCAKASREDRNVGCDDLPAKALNWSSGEQSPGTFQSANTDRSARNHHPTVKPTALMRWLVRLVTPPGGTVLDPFAGSGSTGRAADIEGFDAILIELNPEYVAIAKRRIHGDVPLLEEVESA